MKSPLGELQPGCEWFAFTFSEQLQTSLSKEEVDTLLSTSQEIARDAYSRMDLSNNHKWANHTNKEVDILTESFNIDSPRKIIDFGCGIGRHSIELAKRGHSVLGLDYSDKLIEIATKHAVKNKVSSRTEFLVQDARTFTSEEKFDIATCLYDVIGSFYKKKDSYDIIRSIYNSLSPGGYALISVMNWTPTKKNAIHKIDLKRETTTLLKLKPSRTMEKTGDVFNPEYYAIDKHDNVVYRKEQFKIGEELPVEHVVIDHRFTTKEITSNLASVGFNILWSRCVQSGKWEICLDEDNPSAKEILIACKK